MSEDEVRSEIAKMIKTASKAGDVSLEFAQIDGGGVEINFVGDDGVGVGRTYPDSIGKLLFSFVQSERNEKGYVEVRINLKRRRYSVESYLYMDRPALRVDLRNRLPN